MTARSIASHLATLVIGIAFIAAPMGLLFAVDLPARDWARSPEVLIEELPVPQTDLEWAGRWAAVNMTGICWIGYLLVFDGVLGLFLRGPGGDGSPLRRRPNRFIVAWLTSIPVWCFFDWVNFYYMRAWDYHGLPPLFEQRVAGYFVAFAAISPGMFLAAEFFQRIGVRRLRVESEAGRRAWTWILSIGVLMLIWLWIALVVWFQFRERGDEYVWSLVYLAVPGLITLAFARRVRIVCFVFGFCFATWAIWVGDPIGNLALWVGIIYMLDPLVIWIIGETNDVSPSILNDWQRGRYGRTAALMLGGGLCGLCWEFWNYWALAKWSYNLPFLGRFEEPRYFEMPVVGFIGFFPFAIECWVMLNFILAVFQKVGLRIAEPLRDEDGIM